MKHQRTLRRVTVALMLLVAFLFQGTWALAGTTGGLNGTVTDTKGAPVAGAVVIATSPSQVATVTTVATCEGDVAIMTAPETGAPFVSVTVPLRPPVVPASAHVPWNRKATRSISATATRRRVR